MKNHTSEVSFYVDSLIIEAILKDEKLYKQADAGGMVASLIDKVKGYVGNNIDPNDKSGSLINILGPGAISVAFSSMGLGWLGTLIGLSMRVFNINVKNIISSIWNKLKPAIAGDKEVSSETVDSFVESSVQENYQPATPEEAEKAANTMKTKGANLLIDAKFVKVAMINFQNGTLTKEAAFFDMFNSRKAKTVNILTRVLSWIFKVALASAGLMVAGDVVNKFLNRPNALDGTIQKGHPTETTPAPAVNISKQKKFPIKSGYSPEKNNLGESNWSEGITNDPSTIENMLIDFAKDVYDGLEGKENIIINSPAFQVVKDRIAWYNHTSPQAPLVWIPKYFSSKKQIVDYFIDDVADRTTT
jgi:hypothetical protein